MCSPKSLVNFFGSGVLDYPADQGKSNLVRVCEQASFGHGFAALLETTIFFVRPYYMYIFAPISRQFLDYERYQCILQKIERA